MEGNCSNCGGSVGVECGDAWAYHEPWCKTDSTCPSCHGRETVKRKFGKTRFPACELCSGSGHVKREAARQFSSDRIMRAFDRMEVRR